MKLSDVKKIGKFKYSGCKDLKFSNNLKAYGFIKGVELEVVRIAKSMCVIKIMGCVYSVNRSLADVILLYEGNKHGK